MCRRPPRPRGRANTRGFAPTRTDASSSATSAPGARRGTASRFPRPFDRRRGRSSNRALSASCPPRRPSPSRTPSRSGFAAKSSHDLAALAAAAVSRLARGDGVLARMAGAGARPVTRAGTAQLTAAGQTDAGRVRTNNEDLFVCDGERGIFAVIDGVGGQSAGEVAAAIAQRVVLDRLARPLGSDAERVREAIALANNEIFKASEESPEYRGMTCVLTLALVVDQHVTIGHVGDCRLYELSPRGIRKMTHDHSPVGEREDARELNEADAMKHPRRNEVFRDVGSAHRDKDEAGFVEIVEDTIADDSAILLCTDGLTDLVPSSAIARVVRDYAGDPQAVADVLVAAANDAGGTDNVTVVYAESPEFAHEVRTAWSVPPTVLPPLPLSAPVPVAADVESASSSTPPVPAERPATGWSSILGRGVLWLLAGVFLGIAAALALAWRLYGTPSVTPRTLVVGTGG